jgi:hypothetical protein
MAGDQTTSDPIPPVETSPEPQPVTPEISPNPPIPSNPSSPSDPSVPSEPVPIPEPVATPEPESKPSSQVNIPDLSFPFCGSVPPSLSFNQIPDNEQIKQKFTEWGIVGHNGLDFPFSEGTEILTCDGGKVIQAGDSGDYGVCVTVQHSWGQSVYAHLKETKVTVDQEVKASDLIGLSGQTGSAFGPHLHFAIKPNNPNESNGYLGFIDPAPYLKNTVSSPAPSIPSDPPIPSVPPISTEPEIKIEPSPEIPQVPETPEVPESPEPPQNSQTTQVSPSPSQPPSPPEPTIISGPEELQSQVDQKLAVELESRRQKANEARRQNREEHLAAIEKFLSQKPEITNQDVRDLVHVSQTTATEYLSTLVKSGRIKAEGKGKATVYKNIFG